MAAATEIETPPVEEEELPEATKEVEAVMRRVAATGKASTTSTLFLSSTMAVPDSDEVILGKAAVLFCQLSADARAGKQCPLERAEDMVLFVEDLYLPSRRSQAIAQVTAAEEAKAAALALAIAKRTLTEATEGGDAGAIAAANEALEEAKARASAAQAEFDKATNGPVPDIESLYQFSAKTYELGQFSPETVILSLVLINRLSSVSGIPVGPLTWRIMTLISTLLAQKLWDDASVANSDFPTLLKSVMPGSDIDVKGINRLERKFLSLINYKVTFTGSLYAKYFFELRSIAEENHRKFRLAPLSKEQADRLEARTRSKADTMREGARFASRRAKTSELDGMSSRSRAVLS
jgi:hypothetical protein